VLRVWWVDDVRRRWCVVVAESAHALVLPTWEAAGVVVRLLGKPLGGQLCEVLCS
jgi:hypothetical protein